MRSSIADQLRAARVVRRLTQAQVAASARLSRETVGFVENGADARLSTFTRLAAAMGCRLVVTLQEDEATEDKGTPPY